MARGHHYIYISFPSLTCVFLCTCKWNSIGIPQVLYILSFEPTFQKSRPAFFKITLSLTIDQEKILMAAICWPGFACHFPLQFQKTTCSQLEVGNQNGDVLHAQKNKIRRSQTYTQLKNLLLVTNVSCSPTYHLVHRRAFFSIELSMFTPQRQHC